VNIFVILKKIWYWSYPRETWQYDVMCVAILGFIFLVPARVFDDPEARPRWEGSLKETRVQADTLKDASIESLSAAAGGGVVHRVEVLRASDGKILSYRVWTRPDGN
jgi:hypothetical protein